MAKASSTPESKASTHTQMKVITSVIVFLLSAFLYYYFTNILYRKLILPSVKVEINGSVYSLPEVSKILEKEKIKAERKGQEREVRKIVGMQNTINRLYPYPSFLQILKKNTYRGVRGKVFAFLLFQEVGLMGLFIGFIFYVKRKLTPFFIRMPEIEDPIEVGERFSFLDFNYLKVSQNTIISIFGSLDEFVRLFRVWDTVMIADVKVFKKSDRKKIKPNSVVLDFIEINKDIKKITNELLRYGRANGLIGEGKKEEERFRFAVAISLFHFITGFFGNMPSGFVSPFLKDFSVKRFLSTYAFGKINNVKFLGIEKGKEREPNNWLITFNGFRKEKRDFLKYLKDKYLQVPDLIPLKEVR